MRIRRCSERSIPGHDVPKLSSSCSPSSVRIGFLRILLHRIQGQSEMLQVGFSLFYQPGTVKKLLRIKKICKILQISKTLTAMIKKLAAVFFTVQSLSLCLLPTTVFPFPYIFPFEKLISVGTNLFTLLKCCNYSGNKLFVLSPRSVAK